MAWRHCMDIVWPGGHCMIWSGGPDMGYGMASRASHGLVWPEEHRMVYGMAWPATHSIGRQGMVLGIVYGMAWRSWHGVCYGITGITWYMVWPSGHRMVYGMAWRGMSWYVARHSITCFKALSWVIVPFTRGVGAVSWRSCTYVPDPFTSRGPFTCMFRHTCSSCSLWAGIVNREIVNL